MASAADLRDREKTAATALSSLGEAMAILILFRSGDVTISSDMGITRTFRDTLPAFV